MKIFYFTFADVSQPLGSTRCVLEVVNNWRSFGHTVFLFVPYYTRNKKRKDPFTIYIPTTRIRFLDRFFFYFFSFFYLLFYMYRFKPDVIYSTEMFYTCHHAILARIFGVSHVTEMNGFALDEFRMESVSNLRLALVDFFQRLTYKLVDKVITVTPQIKQRLIDTYEIADKNVYYVPNGVNIKKFRPMNSYTARERLGLDKNLKYIGWVGYFFPWSGVELLVEAGPHIRKRIEGIRFLVVGHGKWGDHLKDCAKKMGVDDLFIFVGAVRSENVPIYINAMDVGTSPYPRERNESSGGSSMKTIEYWACKKPVVITNATGIPEKDILVQNRAGILVDEWSPKAFAKGLISILTDEKMAREMGNRGYELVLRERTWKKISREKERVLLL